MLRLSAGYAEALALFRASETSGEPIIFPTDTIYGIGAPIRSISANEKIYSLKNRPMNKALPILVGSLDMLLPLVEKPSDETVKWLESIWPGANTVIFKASPMLNPLYVQSGTVAIRLVDGWLGEALKTYGAPVTASSVNESGEAPLYDAGAIYGKYKDSCPFMLWGTSGVKSSTIIDVSEGTQKTLRIT
jgi:L-threonylcarbamoyladenylate synthase